MIEFRNVSKHFGAQDVLENASFQINPGDRVGIVGPNGAGKSTIFELIAGEISPDGGEVVLPKNCRLGYLRQTIAGRAITVPLLDYVENAVTDLLAIQHEIAALEKSLHDGTAENPPAALRRLGELQSEFEHRDGYAIRNRAEAALCGLGFTVEQFQQPFSAFSGGWQMRAEMIRVLLSNPEILLLDEPSNYLDIPAVEWLQRHLRDFEGTIVLISHDRFLLNSLTRTTIEVANAFVEVYPGNYDYYARERRLRVEQRQAAQKNQDRKREQIERFIERFRAKNTKSSQVQSRVKMLEKLEFIDIPQTIVSPGKLRLAEPPHCGAEVMRLDDAGLTYDGAHWVLRHVDLRVARGEKTALVGLNGMGKTTLLRMLAGALPPSEGRRVVGHKVNPGYQSQDFADTIDPALTVYEAVKSNAPETPERQVRTLLGGFGFSGLAAMEKKVAVLSGGEKIRLAFARLLIRPPNFLLLDEPTTHLDIAARESLEEALGEYEGTLYLVSHDIQFVRRVATSIIAMTPPGITRYPGNFDYYHEKLTAETARAAAAAQPEKPQVSDRQARKRERAELIQEFARQRRPHEQAMAEAEKRIESLEKEQSVLLNDLTPGGKPVSFSQINQRLTAIQDEIAAVTARWEKAAQALEDVKKEYEGRIPTA